MVNKAEWRRAVAALALGVALLLVALFSRLSTPQFLPGYSASLPIIGGVVLLVYYYQSGIDRRILALRTGLNDREVGQLRMLRLGRLFVGSWLISSIAASIAVFFARPVMDGFVYNIVLACTACSASIAWLGAVVTRVVEYRIFQRVNAGG